MAAIQQHTQGTSSMKLNDADTEKRLVDAILKSPADRAPFIDLAEYLENTGRLEDSKTVYRGMLPVSIQDQHKLDPHPRSASRDIPLCTRLCSYSEEIYPLQPPVNVDEKRNSIFHNQQISVPAEYIDLMENCTLLYDGKNRLYLDSQGIRNSDHSTMNGYLLMPKSLSVKSSTHLEGVSVLLAAHNSHNFYHWHFDLMPCLSLIEASGISLSEVDHFLVDQNNSGFQTRILKAAGVSEHQIQYIDVKQCHVTCEKMIMWRTYNSQGMSQSHRHLDWMRRTFLKKINVLSSDVSRTPERIAVKRTVRGFTNADEVYKKLERKGYYCVLLEELPYHEQVALFANARQVVAPHGAGLTLLAYCKPGTVVHEFYADHVQPCFWSLASALNLEYHNYNCSDVTDKALSSSNKNLGKRLAKTIDVTMHQIDCLP